MSPGTITLVPDPEHTPQGVKISFQAEDPDRLHQMQLLSREAPGDSVIDFVLLQGVTDTATFVSPSVTKQHTKKIVL